MFSLLVIVVALKNNFSRMKLMVYPHVCNAVHLLRSVLISARVALSQIMHGRYALTRSDNFFFKPPLLLRRLLLLLCLFMVSSGLISRIVNCVFPILLSVNARLRLQK